MSSSSIFYDAVQKKPGLREIFACLSCSVFLLSFFYFRQKFNTIQYIQCRSYYKCKFQSKDRGCDFCITLFSFKWLNFLRARKSPHAKWISQILGIFFSSLTVRSTQPQDMESHQILNRKNYPSNKNEEKE